jgi:hypothetical protein
MDNTMAKKKRTNNDLQNETNSKNSFFFKIKFNLFVTYLKVTLSSVKSEIQIIYKISHNKTTVSNKNKVYVYRSKNTQ